MCVLAMAVLRFQGDLVAGESLPWGARIGNALISYCRYLGKMIWPTDMVIFYLHPGYWPMGKILLAGWLILGISVLVWVPRRRYPFLLVGWLWYCGTLVPQGQLVLIASQAMADRWTYVPSIGVLMLAVWGACELTRAWRFRTLALSLAGAGVILLCLALTRHQIGYWQDSETVFRHAADVTPGNPVTHAFLGSALLEKGRLDEAIGQFQEAIRLRPAYAVPHKDFGTALFRKGQMDDAIRQFRQAVSLTPEDAEAHYNLGAALDRKGRIDEAISEFQEAIRLKPDYPAAHYNLGTAFYEQGRIDEAIRQFQEAIRLQPDLAQAHNNLGTALGLKGQTDEAIRQYQEALRLKPDYVDARKNLDVILATRAHSSPPSGALRNP
jgi:tetratricopeptide (TPR) repeat protein